MENESNELEGTSATFVNEIANVSIDTIKDICEIHSKSSGYSIENLMMNTALAILTKLAYELVVKEKREDFLARLLQIINNNFRYCDENKNGNKYGQKLHYVFN